MRTFERRNFQPEKSPEKGLKKEMSECLKKNKETDME